MPVIIVAAALFLIFLVVILIAWVSASVEERHAIQRIAAELCPNCRKQIGSEAVLAARDEYRKKVKELLKSSSEIRFRLVSVWNILCPHCGFAFERRPYGTTEEEKPAIANPGAERSDDD
jgi:hypothetical protein